MSGDHDDPGDGERTVFVPAEGAEPPTPPAAAPPNADEATVFAPAPKAAPTGVGPGAILNNIYQVKRFLARGGMGEVYEGFSVSTDERVAIKVILPSLAADPNVRAMFLREAKVLGTLHHPAVVNYRVAADDPQLNVFYIVTEFIDGAPLSDMLAQLDPSPEDLRRLTRRLAEGLGAAHARGVIHRDMSPDNVLLPDRRLEHAKIIDFGIAKDTDPSKGTIVGDGFAGKLGYVAPEQFGDYDRTVGPWTDVYSLGLVILALVQKRNVDMGATLVEAVDKRRAGPDLSTVPAELRPVLAGMLAADPAKRLRSMDEVVAALDAVIAPQPGGKPAKPAKPPPKAPLKAAPPIGRAAPAPGGSNRLPLIAGGAAVVLALIGGLVFWLVSATKPKAPPPAMVQANLRQVIETALPGVSCSWLDLTDVGGGPQGATVRLRGVAGRPPAVQSALSGAAGRTGLVLANLNLDEVAPVGDPLCTALDTVRTVRAAGVSALSTPQRRFEIVQQPDGDVAAQAVINMAPRDPSIDLALIGLEPDGTMTLLVKDRADLMRNVAAGRISDLGGDSYRLQIKTTHSGWSGMLLVIGKGPFDPNLLEGGVTNRGADWPQRFRAAAARGGWRTEMVWYRTARAGES